MAPDSKSPHDPFAPPRAETDGDAEGPVSRAALGAIAFGTILSMAWAIYLDLKLQGNLGTHGLIRIIGTPVLWAGAIGLLYARVSWAGVACRGLAILMVLGTLYSILTGGSWLFYTATTLRAITFATVFVLLRAPRAGTLLASRED